MKTMAKRGIGIAFILAVVATVVAIASVAIVADAGPNDNNQNRVSVTLTYTEGITWYVSNPYVTFPNQTDDQILDLPRGSVISVRASANAGYEGTPVLLANNSPYVAGTDYTVRVDTVFTASDVHRSPPKTEYIINGEVYTTVQRDPTYNHYLQVLYVNDRADVIVYGWRNSAGAPLTDNTVSPGDQGWEKVYADFEYKKYRVTFYNTQGMKWVCNGVDQSGGSDIYIDYGKTVSVTGVVQQGYEGTPVLKLNNAAYTPGTVHTVVGDVNFTATGVKAALSAKTCYVTLKYTAGVTWEIDGIVYNYTADYTRTFSSGTAITVRARVNEGYEGTPVIQVNYDIYDGGRYTVTNDTTFTAMGVKKVTGGETGYAIVLHSGDGGKVEGAGTYPGSSTAVIRAVPDKGFVFVEWSDGVKDPERTIVVGSRIELTATFAAAPDSDHAADSVALAAMALGCIAAIGGLIWFIRVRIF